MEIATNFAGADSQGANIRSLSGSESLQSHQDRASLFELDADRFSEWLHAIVPSKHSSGDTESPDASVNYWRADSPHGAVSHRIHDQTIIPSPQPLEEPDCCTEAHPIDQCRSLYGTCVPIPISLPFVEARAKQVACDEEGRSMNRHDCLQDSSEGWYDDSGFTLASAEKFLQLLEHQQSQWLTIPNSNFLLPLPKLLG
jgi:hypothetical protein